MTDAAAAAVVLPFTAPYAPDDAALIRAFIVETRLDEAAERRIDQRTMALITTIRNWRTSCASSRFRPARDWH